MQVASPGCDFGSGHAAEKLCDVVAEPAFTAESAIIMRISRPKLLAFVFLAVCTVLACPVTSHAQHVRRSGGPAEGGRLVIWRIPGLGNDLIVGVLIDGRRVANINYGGHFESILAPGRHVIGVEAFPQPYPREPWTTTIDVRPGQIYNFTAKGGTDQLILKRS